MTREADFLLAMASQAQSEDEAVRTGAPLRPAEPERPSAQPSPSPERKRTDRWKTGHRMCFLVDESLFEEFKERAYENHDYMSSVLRDAIRSYVAEHGGGHV